MEKRAISHRISAETVTKLNDFIRDIKAKYPYAARLAISTIYDEIVNLGIEVLANHPQLLVDDSVDIRVSF